MRRGWVISMAVAATLGLLLALRSAIPTVSYSHPVEAFLAERPATMTIDMEGLYGGAERRALLDPAESLPRWARLPYASAAALSRYARTCRPEDAPSGATGELVKALVWARSTCEATPLGDAFFAAPPYLHPSGRSYVSLAAHERGAEWVRAHAGLLAATELAGVGGLERSFALLGQLSRGALHALARGDLVVVDRHWVLLRTPRGLDDEHDVVRVYPRAAWDAFSRGQPLELSPRTVGQHCVALASPDLCWTSPPPSWTRAAVAASLVTAALSLAFMVVWRVRTERRAASARAFILRTLTHELRTPATSLGLDLEPLRLAYDDLPAAVQEPFLRACDDAERIKRVLLVTGRWLSLHERGRALSVTRLPATGSFVRSIVEAYGGEVRFVAPPEDHALATDADWLELAVKNLVDNALTHGKPPVEVAVRWEHRRLVIDVVDAGDTRGVALAALVAEFEKGPGSTGLGLGLSIVARVAKALGRWLEHLPAPTTFRLVVADLPRASA